jgi:hypothetical protein
LGYFVCEATDVAAEIFLIVDGVYDISETSRLASWLTAFERTNIQAIAQKKLLVK